MKWRITIEVTRSEKQDAPAQDTPAPSADVNVPPRPSGLATPSVPRDLGVYL